MQASESVGIGHPDKIADVISDRILEEVLKRDQKAQCAVEVLASQGLIVVAGEISGRDLETIDTHSIINEILDGLGYAVDAFKVVLNIREQSQDIRSTSVQVPEGVVSGDQSMVFGYASDETENYMPLSFEVISNMSKAMGECTRGGKVFGAGYDSKGLIVLDGKEVKTLIFSVQHAPGVDMDSFRNSVYQEVIAPVINKYGLLCSRGNVLINSSGKFVIGGLGADTGITNRKLMVDSYGTRVHHGGGGYSGKDLTKVDRLGAYYARWICKNMVAAGACKSLELQLVFHCGSSIPLFFIDNADSKYPSEILHFIISKAFKYQFSEVYEMFNVSGIKYSDLACFGHFGRSGVPWEELNKVKDIREIIDGGLH